MLCCTFLFGFEFRVSLEQKSPLVFSQTSTNLTGREEGCFQCLFWSSGQLSCLEVSAFPAPQRGAFTSSMCSARGWNKSEFFLTPALRTRSLASMAGVRPARSPSLFLCCSVASDKNISPWTLLWSCSNPVVCWWAEPGQPWEGNGREFRHSD